MRQWHLTVMAGLLAALCSCESDNDADTSLYPNVEGVWSATVTLGEGNNRLVDFPVSLAITQSNGTLSADPDNAGTTLTGTVTTEGAIQLQQESNGASAEGLCVIRMTFNGHVEGNTMTGNMELVFDYAATGQVLRRNGEVTLTRS